MKVAQVNDQAFLKIDPGQVEKLVLFVCETIDLQGDELYIHFVSKEKICELHKIYFDDPSPTDCITCPIDGPIKSKDAPPPHITGEVFICPQVAEETKPDAPYFELSLYIVHTLLHLSGLEDKEEEDIAEMRAAEKRILALLEEKNLLLTISHLRIT